MSNTTVLYVGSLQRAQALDLNVRHTEDMMDALAMYIFEYPDFVVIEDSSPIAAEVYMHLRSINEDRIILLTDNPEHYEIDSPVRVYPADTRADVLYNIICDTSLKVK